MNHKHETVVHGTQMITDKEKARRTRMRFEIETAISNGGSAKDLEEAVDRIIAIHEANKPKSEPVAVVEYSDYQTVAAMIGDVPKKVAVRELFEGALVKGSFLYSAPPIREPLSEDDLLNIVEQCTVRPQVSHILVARAVEQAHGIGGEQ